MTMPAGLLGDITTASPAEVSRRFQQIITATDWAPATQLFDMLFADLVDQAYQAPRLFTYVDLFAGAGGSSIGLTMAGGQLLFAANHSQTATDTHARNFRNAAHECADLDHYDMRKLPYADILWGSPICTEISPSAGRARRRKPTQQIHPGQAQLLEEAGPVDSTLYERTRATFLDIVRAAEARRFPIVVVENVPEAAIEWELFWWWVEGMIFLGYEWQILCVSAAHVGDETNPHAAQRRNRMYVVFNFKGVPKPDMEPRPASICDDCGPVQGVQHWKRPEGVPTASGRLLRVGNYGPRSGQYFYRCPNQPCGRPVAPIERPAATIIDWSDVGYPIGERAARGDRPLVDNTLNRILRGMREQHRPAVSAASPYQAGASWQRLITAGVTPLIDTMRNHAVPLPAGRDPLTTVTTARHHALVVPYYRTGVAKAAHRHPFDTVTTKDRFALACPADVGDVTMDDVMRASYRLTRPEESARAQRFPRVYEIVGNDTEIRLQVGNAVASNVAQMIGQRCAAVLNRTAAHV